MSNCTNALLRDLPVGAVSAPHRQQLLLAAPLLPQYRRGLLMHPRPPRHPGGLPLHFQQARHQFQRHVVLVTDSRQ